MNWYSIKYKGMTTKHFWLQYSFSHQKTIIGYNEQIGWNPLCLLSWAIFVSKPDVCFFLTNSIISLNLIGINMCVVQTANSEGTSPRIDWNQRGTPVGGTGKKEQKEHPLAFSWDIPSGKLDLGVLFFLLSCRNNRHQRMNETPSPSQTPGVADLSEAQGLVKRARQFYLFFGAPAVTVLRIVYVKHHRGSFGPIRSSFVNNTNPISHIISFGRKLPFRASPLFYWSMSLFSVPLFETTRPHTPTILL